MSSTKVLVTGATGFTGINLVRRFARAGCGVIAIDRVPPDAQAEYFLSECLPRVTFVSVDLRDPRWYESIPQEGIDIVVHAAAVTNPRGSEELTRAADAVDINVGTAVRLAGWAAERSVGRFLFVSSSAPYGAALVGRDAIDEDAVVAPENLYAITKYAGERAVQRIGALKGLPAVVVRFTSAYGPMERATPDRTHTSAVHQWCTAAIEGEEIVVDRTMIPRDYTHIDDVSDAMYALTTAPQLRHAVYNVSTGKAQTHDDLLQALRKRLPALRVRYHGEATGRHAERRPFSTTRLRSDTGWSAQYDLGRGVAAYIDWLEMQP